MYDLRKESFQFCMKLNSRLIAIDAEREAGLVNCSRVIIVPLVVKGDPIPSSCVHISAGKLLDLNHFFFSQYS